MLRNTQAIGHNPVPQLSPNGGGVTDCGNSNNNKQQVLHYSESKDPCLRLHIFLLLLINCFAVCFARQFNNFIFYH